MTASVFDALNRLKARNQVLEESIQRVLDLCDAAESGPDRPLVPMRSLYVDEVRTAIAGTVTIGSGTGPRPHETFTALADPAVQEFHDFTQRVANALLVLLSFPNPDSPAADIGLAIRDLIAAKVEPQPVGR